MSQFAADTVEAIFKFTVFPADVATSQDCLTKPLADPVAPLVVALIAPIEKSCDPFITAEPSRRIPKAASPVPTGAVIDKASSRIADVPAGAIKLRFESEKFDVKVTWAVVSVCPLAVLVMYCGMFYSIRF